MSDSIIGTCTLMCSRRERLFREREGLLNRLEIDESTKHLKYPKADIAKTVKCYKRSSAGMSVNEPSELRPGPVLQLTLKYLIIEVLTRKNINWSAIYEFAFDRIRAIRQDMIVQRLDITMNIILLEPIVRFYIYSAEKMCEAPAIEYVPKFNEQNLLECIKQLLVMYDELEESNIEWSSSDLEEKTKCSRQKIDDSRVQIEALYLLLYMGNVTALQRGLSLPVKYRNTPQIKNALEISLAWYNNNYVRVCREITQLTPLFAMAALINLRSIKRCSLQIMSSGYNCKNNAYNIQDLKNILLYNDIKKIFADCTLYGIKYDNNNIYFQKGRLKNIETLAHPEKYFTDPALDKLLPDILLN